MTHRSSLSLRILLSLGFFAGECLKNRQLIAGNVDAETLAGVEQGLDEKLKVLAKLIDKQQGDRIFFEGVFTEKELASMKELACKYSALDRIQKCRGIFSKNIETILYSPELSKDINRGDYIGGLGYVLNRIKMNEEDFIITFSEINASYMLNLYKLNNLDKKKNVLELLNNLSTIEEFNSFDSSLQSSILESSEPISHIAFSVQDGKNNRAFKVSEKLNDSVLNEILRKEESYFLIQDFSNNYKK